MKTFAVVLSTLLLVALAAAQNTALRWYAFSAGFGLSSSPSQKTTSILGQPFVGIAQGASSYVYSGFLADTLLRGRVTDVEEPVALPREYALGQNYPNPFNPTTTIRFQIPASTGEKSGAKRVRLMVYDLLGREVATIVNEQLDAGSYTRTFTGEGLASGVYIYVMRAGSFVQSKKMMLIR